MAPVPAPASAAEAVSMVLAGLTYLATADPAALAVQAQAECLQGLEQAAAIATRHMRIFIDGLRPPTQVPPLLPEAPTPDQLFANLRTTD